MKPLVITLVVNVNVLVAARERLDYKAKLCACTADKHGDLILSREYYNY